LIRLALAVVLLGTQAWAASRSEPSPEQRAKLALIEARVALKTAQDAYLQKGDLHETNTALDQMERSVQLAYDSLLATHKNPSRSPKHFKHAEIATREILRRLDDFRERMNFDDRAGLDKARAAIQKVHDSLLQGIMGGKKK
jgi:hypothetical protein